VEGPKQDKKEPIKFYASIQQKGDGSEDEKVGAEKK
jgi:hypothetical protein